MTFIVAIGACLTKYVQLSGRASRSEFWFFALFQVIVFCVASVVDGSLLVLTWLVLLLPGFAVSVRRLHDTGRSGWWTFIQLVPLIGTILLIVWYASDGVRSPNEWGEPLVDASADRAQSPLPNAPRLVQADVAQQLAELSRLHCAGHLTLDEFNRAKAKALLSS